MSFGGKKTSTTAPQLNQVQVQTSAYGVVIPVGWGTFRISPNLLWYGGFTATQHTSTTSAGGKGGGGQTTTIDYTYTASIIMGLHLGQVDGVSTIWRDKSVFIDGGTTALAQAGLSLAAGTLGQAVWGYLTTNFPSQARGYSDLAYVYAQDYSLSSQASLANHSAEVYRRRASLPAGGTSPDANPADIVSDFLTSAIYGVPGWPSGAVASLTDYSNYCFAAGLLLSPLLDSQRAARDFLTEILQASNSDAAWTGGQLKIVPYGDTQITGNGVTWTPSLSALYDLNADALLPPGQGEEPIKRQIKRPADCFNAISLEFTDRSHGYNTSVSGYVDQAMSDQFGLVKAQSPYSLHSIASQAVADAAGPLILQRACYVRRTFTLRLPWNYGLLDPMDICTLTFGNLNGQAARVTEINEQQDGDLEVTFEEMLVGVHHAPVYARSEPSGYSPNQELAPGSISTPLFYSPPGSLTGGDLELWIAVAGTGANWGGCEAWISLDGNNYERFGSINGGARYGVLTGTLALHADPDTTGTVGVDLSASNGKLLTATQAQADGFSTLCLIGGELVSYRDAALTSTSHYTLTYFRRGLYSTPVASHTAGASFLRLDQSVFRYPFTKGRVGQTVYFKFLSFNSFGKARQQLSDVSPYTFTLGAITSTPGASDWAVTGSAFIGAGQSPAIIIDGTVVDLNAQTVIVDYRERLTLTPTWGPWASKEFPITATRLVIEGVKDNTFYGVQVRYRSLQGVEAIGSGVDLGVIKTGTITIPNQGLLATLNAIEDAQLHAGVGQNCLVDTDFSQSFNYWRAGGDDAVTPTRQQTGAGLRYLQNQMSGAAGHTLFLASDNQINSLPLQPGEPVELQARVGGVNLSAIDIEVRWHDAAGVALSSPSTSAGAGFSPPLQSVSSFGAGGGEVDSYTKIGGFIVAPANAYRASLWVRGTVTGTGTASLRLLQPMLAKAKSGSATLTQWNPGFRGDPKADVTATNTAAGIAGQGALATLNTVDASVLADGVFGQNLILNPGAETANTSGWANALLSRGAGGTLSASNTSSAAGGYSFVITKASTSDGAGFGCRALPVIAGKKYRVRVWVSGSSSTSAGLYLQLYERSGTPSGGYVNETNKSSFTDLVANGPVAAAWTLYDFVYTVPAGIQYVSLTMFSWTAAPTTLAFDACDFQEVLSLGSAGALFQEDGVTRLTDSTAVTSLGTAAAITGQGTGATTNVGTMAVHNIFRQTTMPTTGMGSGDFWVDTSSTPQIVHVYDASSNTWPKASATLAAEVQFASGSTIESLKPGQAGADVTASNTAAAIAGQGTGATTNVGSLATLSTVTTSYVTTGAITSVTVDTVVNNIALSNNSLPASRTGAMNDTTITTNGTGAVTCRGQANMLVNTTGDYTVQADFYRATVFVDSAYFQVRGNNQTFMFEFVDPSPPSGSIEYYVYFWVQTGASLGVQLKKSWMTLSELKK